MINRHFEWAGMLYWTLAGQRVKLEWIAVKVGFIEVWLQKMYSFEDSQKVWNVSFLLFILSLIGFIISINHRVFCPICKKQDKKQNNEYIIDFPFSHLFSYLARQQAGCKSLLIVSHSRLSELLIHKPANGGWEERPSNQNPSCILAKTVKI